jgi:hypothetical protein
MLGSVVRILQIVAIMGTLAAVPRMANFQRDAMKMMAAAQKGDLGDTLPNAELGDANPMSEELSGSPLAALASLKSLGKLIPGNSEGSETAEKSPPTPKGPMTIILHGDARRQDESSVTNLPPGSHATVVDGRVQIFKPGGK